VPHAWVIIPFCVGTRPDALRLGAQNTPPVSHVLRICVNLKCTREDIKFLGVIKQDFLEESFGRIESGSGQHVLDAIVTIHAPLSLWERAYRFRDLAFLPSLFILRIEGEMNSYRL
jgi:hypothetical protein